jgi:pilus assembly protein Flp/PilA
MNRIVRFFAEEDGVTMVEYGLLAALIAVICVVAVAGIGTKLNLTFEHIRDCLADVTKC